MRRDFALPGTRARYAPDRTCDVRHIKLALDIDVENQRITGRCSLTLIPLTPEPKRLRLDAMELEINRVSCADEELPHAHDGESLIIDLSHRTSEWVEKTSPSDTLFMAGESRFAPFVLDVDYSATPRRGMYFVGPDDGYPDKYVQVWTQGQDEDARYWFPCIDAPHQKATSEIIVTVPVHFTTLSNGALIDDTAHDSRRTMHWRLDSPHSSYLITLVAGEFSILRESWRAPDGREVEVSCYVEPGREADAQRTIHRTSEMLELFSRLFGVPYPYSKYAQIFVSDFIFGGMENTTATTLTDTLLVDNRAQADYPVDSLIAHELAHQWFGNLVTCREWGESWLNEGFATYAEYLWREHADGRDPADVELAAWGQSYFEEDSQRYRRPVATRMYGEPLEIFDRHLYEKGGRVLHMLRALLGDRVFFEALAHYANKHRYKSVHTRDLIVAIEEATGRSLDWFFEQWVTNGAGHPELSVHYTWDAGLGMACVIVDQEQEIDRETPLFRLPTRLRFRVGEASHDWDFDIEITEKHQTFHIALPGAPTQAIFDPGRVLLAKVKTEKSTELWCNELAHATLAGDRAHAAEKLGEIGDRRATGALIAALERDPFWSVRAHAAAALGEISSERARDALIAAVSGTWHAKARRAVVKSLGAWRDDERVADVLVELIQSGDASYFVEAEACLSLGKTRSKRAPEVLRQASERDSFMDIIRQKAYQGLAEARDYSANTFLSEATRYGRQPYGRRAALMALARLHAGEHGHQAQGARELAERLLFDKAFRVQYGAIEALAVFADAATIPALEKLIARTLDGRLRRRAREVVRDIRSGESIRARIEALESELERVRKSATDMRERLERLEAAVAFGPGKRNKKHKKHKEHKKQKKEGRESGEAGQD